MHMHMFIVYIKRHEPGRGPARRTSSADPTYPGSLRLTLILGNTNNTSNNEYE